MSLRAVNLNLIPILQALLRERSVVSASAALDLSPAATSEALSRLRALLDDPLLVRVGRNMELTPAAAALIEPVNRLCTDVEGLLKQGLPFDPRHSKQHFKIASNDSIVFVFARRILNAVRAQAPSVQVHFCEPDLDVCEQMASREIDLLLMPRLFTESLGSAAPMRCRTVFRDRLVVVFSGCHPLAAKAEVTAEDLAPYPQILYNPTTATLEGRLERGVLGPVGFNVAMRVTQLLMIPFLVAYPPYVSWLPHSLVDGLGPSLQLQSREVPSTSCDLDTCLAWSPVLDMDPAHRWFRELVIATIQRD